MSHELRTPLNAIIGFSGVLMRRLKGAINSQDERLLHNILHSGEHLLRLIDDVLDLAMIDAGQLELRPEAVDLRELLEGVCIVARGSAAKKGSTVDLEVAPELGTVTAEPSKIKHIVYHLITNAVKFSPDEATVTVRAQPASGRDGVCIDVIDHGIGIAPENQQVIFEEFRQVDDGPSRRFEGTGLGLALVKQLLELHGGEITVRSELGKGSTFSAFLPRVAVTVAGSSPEPSTSDTTA
jgi:signal transduction histidine kinase